MRLLEKEPDRRYQSADGLRQDLRRIHASLLNGTTGQFALGQFDFGTRLEPPAQLVGRDGELTVLREFLAATQADAPCLLIKGRAGVGKSALLEQLRPLVAARRGWFIHSKFDQYR